MRPPGTRLFRTVRVATTLTRGDWANYPARSPEPFSEVSVVWWSEPVASEEMTLHDAVLAMGSLHQPIDTLLTPDQLNGYVNRSACRGLDDITGFLTG